MIHKKINFLTKIFFVFLLFVSFSNNVKAEEDQELSEITARISIKADVCNAEYCNFVLILLKNHFQMSSLCPTYAGVRHSH